MTGLRVRLHKQKLSHNSNERIQLRKRCSKRKAQSWKFWTSATKSRLTSCSDRGRISQLRIWSRPRWTIWLWATCTIDTCLSSGIHCKSDGWDQIKRLLKRLFKCLITKTTLMASQANSKRGIAVFLKSIRDLNHLLVAESWLASWQKRGDWTGKYSTERAKISLRWSTDLTVSSWSSQMTGMEVEIRSVL